MFRFAHPIRFVATVLASLVVTIAMPHCLRAQQGVTVGANDIGGVVTGSKRPEAGVWVIAETTETPAKFTRIVVTDDQGRYLIPDLPSADYSVWVRGYGLIDSPKMRAKPGSRLDLAAVTASNGRSGALLSGALLVHADVDSAGVRPP